MLPGWVAFIENVPVFDGEVDTCGDAGLLRYTGQ